MSTRPPNDDEIKIFSDLLEKNRYDFVALAYIIFPFGQKGHELEHKDLYDWQVEELINLSKWLQNPETRYQTYRMIVSSGNGAAKTALGAIVNIILLYTQKLRARITANTAPQMTTVVWPEYDKWLRFARYNEFYFEKFGTSIKARNVAEANIWRLDAVTWNEQSPASVSGLHNEGFAVSITFEEAPGIPAVIWGYAKGAFTEKNTIKIWMAFGNSDDPESKFEQNMTSALWHSRRIDTRTLPHSDKKELADWLMECGGNEDADEFRVRVRGLPRKTSKDSIIAVDNVLAALERAEGFDKSSVTILPCIITVDPAWQGGDDTCIAYHQGNYSCLLEKFKLDKKSGETHQLTYSKVCYWERELKADAVWVDQGEGTTLFTLATNAGKTHWELISFAGEANDKPEFKDREYQNIRAQMYYEFDKFLLKGGVLDARDPEWKESIKKQLCWTKGGRHKISNKKIAEPKVDIKARVGASPDVADVLVLRGARTLMERREENLSDGERTQVGSNPLMMPSHRDPYDDDAIDVDFQELYG